MITANRRASATIAFFIPRCLAIFIAQALYGHSLQPTALPNQKAAKYCGCLNGPSCRIIRL
jgi:hypothetical protein